MRDQKKERTGPWDGFWQGLNGLVELLRRAEEQGGLWQKNGYFGDGQKLQGAYNLSVRLGLGEQSEIGQLVEGPLASRAAGNKVVRRLPALRWEIMEEKGGWLVLVEIPALEEESLRIAVGPGRLELRARAAGREIGETIPIAGLPGGTPCTTRYRNGILEIRLAAKGEGANP